MSVLLALGLLEVLLLGVLAHAPEAAGMPWPGLGLWAGAFAAYAGAAAALTRRRPGGAAPARVAVSDGTLLLWIWTLGILARLLLLPAPPVLSDDLYRYVWDGWTQVRGLDPFLLPPAEAVETLGPLPGISDRINHPEIRTIYPGGAQLLFGALAWLTPSVPLFKSAFVAADLGVAWCVWRLARCRRGPVRDGDGAGDRPEPGGDEPAGAGGAPGLALLLYLWCPLPIVEVAWSGHLEPLALLPMMAALLAAGKRRAFGAGALLGLGTAVKWLPILGLPALARRHGAAVAAAGLAVVALSWLPYLDAGARLAEGLGAFALHWEFNPGAFDLLRGLLGDGAPPRLAAGAVVLGVVAVGTVRRWSAERALYWALGAALLLAPTLHPWYALWILPLAALRRGRTWILFAGLVVLGYWGRDAYLATGAWPRPAWVGLAVHGPLVAGLAWEALRSPSSLRGGRAGERSG